MNQPRIRLPRYFFIYIFFLKKCLYLPYIHLYTHNLLHYYKAGDQASSVELLVNCKTVGFFSEISKEICKAWRTESQITCARRERKKTVSPQSRSLFLASFQTFCLTARPYLDTQNKDCFAV